MYLQLTALGGALDNCLWFLLPEEIFADLKCMNKSIRDHYCGLLKLVKF